MTERPHPQKSGDAYRTIGEVAEELHVPQHVLRFWETRFPDVKPLKRAGGRRFYRPEDVALLRAVQTLLYADGYTIKGVQRLLVEFGPQHVAEALARSTLTAVPPLRDERDEGPRQEPAGAVGRHERHSPSSAANAVPLDAAVAGSSVRRSSAADLASRLEAVLADLSDCRLLLSSVYPAVD